MGDGKADEGWEMAFEDTVSVVQVRAYKDKIETDKIGCTAFLADWLSLLPDQLTRDLLELAAEELAELAKEFADPPETSPPGRPKRFDFKNGGRRGH